VAAHYELDPVDVLVEKLCKAQKLPLWFFHSRNDQMCPFELIEDLVRRLRSASRSEVHLTDFEDNWSKMGHCADRVSYWTAPGQKLWKGDELFAWLASQVGPGRLEAAERAVAAAKIV
ncbi:unnamed protein product, partial [Polarella glacialis]